jgi:hypothetical protein
MQQVLDLLRMSEEATKTQWIEYNMWLALYLVVWLHSRGACLCLLMLSDVNCMYNHLAYG